MKSKTQRATGCTLDYNNLVALSTMWAQAVNGPIAAAVKSQVEDKKSPTYLTLKQHDANLLLLLRTWAQSTAIISDEIVERLKEIKKIIEENPEEYAAYLKATGQVAQEPETPKEEGKNETN
jgi:hypothetical protein